MMKKLEELTKVGLAHSSRQVRAAGDMVEVLRLHLFLVSLTMIEVVEVRHDDGNWQGDCEHTGDGAQGTDNLSPHSDRPIS